MMWPCVAPCLPVTVNRLFESATSNADVIPFLRSQTCESYAVALLFDHWIENVIEYTPAVANVIRLPLTMLTPLLSGSDVLSVMIAVAFADGIV